MRTPCLVILAIAGAFCWAGRANAAPRPADVSPAAERTSMLLAEIQKETRGLVSSAETLGTFARSVNYSWVSHSNHLNRVREHINRVSEHLDEFAQMRHEVLPWQREAFQRVTSHAAEVAASTQAAIVHLRENQDLLWLPEYRSHLTTISSNFESMKETVDKFRDYDQTQRRLQGLEGQLEISGS